MCSDFFSFLKEALPWAAGVAFLFIICRTIARMRDSDNQVEQTFWSDLDE